MKIQLKNLSATALLLLVLSGSALAQTLADAAREVVMTSQRLVAEVAALEPQTWGTETALADLRRLNASAKALENALTGQDASELKPLQTDLSSARRRVETSSALLPAENRQELSDLLAQVDQIDERLTELRLRFAGKASVIASTVGQSSLEPATDGLPYYDNPAQILIDVRDLRRNAESLQTGWFPAFGFFGVGNTPNNLDSLQVRRFILAIYDLERLLSTDYEDVRQSKPLWDEVVRRYNRLGYLPPSTVTRQLERNLDRLSSFYDSL